MNLLDSTFAVDPATFTVGPTAAPTLPQPFGAAGATLLHFAQLNAATGEGALKSLRGFRTKSRRVAWCYPAEFARVSPQGIAEWGRRLVIEGRVESLVACGPGARELATAVRDAGLAIGRVVVCADDVTGRNVLCDSLGPGDLILALGVDADNCRRLAERLEWRIHRPARRDGMNSNPKPKI